MNNHKLLLIFILFPLLWAACKAKPKEDGVKETRTSGTTTILVDDAYTDLINNQIAVFKSDYPNATIKTILGWLQLFRFTFYIKCFILHNGNMSFLANSIKAICISTGN